MSAVLFAGGGTGGHLYPALALADAMQALRPSLRVHFVGAQRGVEVRVLPQKGVPHTLLPLEPLRRSEPWRNWRLVPSAVRSALGLRRLFRAERPALLVSTGGYASAYAGLWALTHGVPVAVQEQNAYPGLTQRLLARRARQIHLGFPEAERHLSRRQEAEVLSFGNPIQPPDPALDRAACRSGFGLSPEATVALVVGGSQGAKPVNDALLEALEGVAAGRLERPAGLELLWATGPAHIEGIRTRLAALAGLEWVRPVGYIDAMPRALAAADLAVSRAGAMATAELLAWGVPAVLVPLPTAAADHQRLNAEALAEAGAAVDLPQSEATPERLWAELARLAADADLRAGMAERALRRGSPDAARRIAAKLLELVGPA